MDASGFALAFDQPLLQEPDSVYSSRASDVGSRMLSKRKTRTRYPYYDRYYLEGTALFKDIERAAHEEDIELSTIDLRGQDEDLFATYKSVDKYVKINVIHLVASVGSIRVMAWMKKVCGHDVLNQRALLMTNRNDDDGILHYTPIMSALFMSKTEAVIWLVNQDVDLDAANADGLTPCHMLAWTALFNEQPETRYKNIERIITKLVEKHADLSKKAGEFEHRKDKEAEHFRRKTPLQIASWTASQFPKSLLHLLTSSYHTPEKARLVAEVSSVARILPSAADVFVSKLAVKENGTLHSQLQEEIRLLVQRNRHRKTFLGILMRSPVAASQLLKLLMCKPQVTNPQKYPLPSHAKMPNERMICTYQPADDEPVWRTYDDGKPPEWHSVFNQDGLDAPGPFSEAYSVKVKVLYMPGILSRRILCILSTLVQQEHLKLFSQIPVSGMVTCIWTYLLGLTNLLFAWDLLLLLVFFGVAIWRPHESHIAHDIAGSVILAEVFMGAHGIINSVTWSWRWYASEDPPGWAELPKEVYLANFKMVDIITQTVLVLGLATCRTEAPLAPGAPAYERVVLALSIIIWCCRIISHLQVVPVIGPLILAVAHSFSPMRGMFALMAMVFGTFLSAFIIFKDDNRSVIFVLLYLYEMLVLSDREASESISGIDIAHEQTLDFDQEMYTGGGQTWLLIVSSCVALFGMSFFSIVLLNLTIGMYANYYQEMEPLAMLIFEKCRAKHCMQCMLLPSYAMAVKLYRRDHHKRLPIFFCVACIVAYIFTVMCRSRTYVPAVLLVGAVYWAQVLCLVDIGDINKQNNFLWICYRADYDEEFYRKVRGEQYDLCNLQRDLSRLERDLNESKSSTDSKLEDLASQIAETNKNVQLVLRKLENVETTSPPIAETSGRDYHGMFVDSPTPWGITTERVKDFIETVNTIKSRTPRRD